ncbi:SixA phosphatase family protein [Sphingomonas montana]|uniref:SixA phosphatase family protein n=1 Tax=Sphingomonas montana TaxID=1843236 RepID=UPI00096F7A5A|nr:histidine phosphatase family protein [Sphingomonas montana]
MKTLILLRHAKSGWDDTVSRDFDRPLNPKGKRAGRTVGQHMRTLGLAFDAAVASPAVRVVETLAQVADGYGVAIDPAWDRRIYLASATTLLDVVRETDDAAATLLLVGHNPGLEDLVLALVPDRNGNLERNKVEEKFPTASLAVLHFEIDLWADVKPGSGTLIRFIRPRDLDPTLGPDT